MLDSSVSVQFSSVRVSVHLNCAKVFQFRQTRAERAGELALKSKNTADARAVSCHSHATLIRNVLLIMEMTAMGLIVYCLDRCLDRWIHSCCVKRILTNF